MNDKLERLRAVLGEFESAIVAFSQASLAMRRARSSFSQSRATTKSASVCDSFATSACRVAADRSARASNSSRIGAR